MGIVVVDKWCLVGWWGCCRWIVCVELGLRGIKPFGVRAGGSAVDCLAGFVFVVVTMSCDKRAPAVNCTTNETINTIFELDQHLSSFLDVTSPSSSPHLNFMTSDMLAPDHHKNLRSSSPCSFLASSLPLLVCALEPFAEHQGNISVQSLQAVPLAFAQVGASNCRQARGGAETHQGCNRGWRW